MKTLITFVLVMSLGSEALSSPGPKFNSNEGLAREVTDQAFELFDAKKYQDCIDMGLKAIGLYERTPNAHFALGKCYEKIGEFESSYAHFHRATELDSTDKDAFHNRAVQSLKLLEIERLKKDIAEWKKASPDDKRILEYKTLLQETEAFIKTKKLTVEQMRQQVKEIYLQYVKERDK